MAKLYHQSLQSARRRSFGAGPAGCCSWSQLAVHSVVHIHSVAPSFTVTCSAARCSALFCHPRWCVHVCHFTVHGGFKLTNNVHDLLSAIVEHSCVESCHLQRKGSSILIAMHGEYCQILSPAATESCGAPGLLLLFGFHSARHADSFDAAQSGRELARARSNDVLTT